MNTPLLLASASPRRRELINRLGREVIAASTEADESAPENTPARDVPELLAARKADAALLLPEAEGRVVIAADTVVILDGMIFGKPLDRDDARRMLRLLSGNTHQVVTGVCVTAPGGMRKCFSESTDVIFFPLSDSQIDRYISGGEPMDKAGAYGIQGGGCMLVEGIKGDYYNVVGLPVARLGRVLDEMGV